MTTSGYCNSRPHDRYSGSRNKSGSILQSSFRLGYEGNYKSEAAIFGDSHIGRRAKDCADGEIQIREFRLPDDLDERN